MWHCSGGTAQYNDLLAASSCPYTSPNTGRMMEMFAAPHGDGTPAQSRCRPSRKKSGTEPTLDEMLREPAIHLIMRRDNVPEDQLLHFIKLACRHIKGE